MREAGAQGSGCAPAEIVGHDKPERGTAGSQADILQGCELVGARDDQYGSGEQPEPGPAGGRHRQVPKRQEGRQWHQADHRPGEQVAAHEGDRRQRAFTARLDDPPVREHDRPDRREHHRHHHPDPHREEGRGRHPIGHPGPDLAQPGDHPLHVARLPHREVPAHQAERDQRPDGQRRGSPAHQAPGSTRPVGLLIASGSNRLCQAPAAFRWGYPFDGRILANFGGLFRDLQL